MPQKKNNSNNSEKPQNAYFLSLELENVRCFGEKQAVDFSDRNKKPKQWTIILGDNGTGKTTILKTLLAICPRVKKENGKIDFISPQYTNAIIWKGWDFKRSNNLRFKIDVWFSKGRYFTNVDEIFGFHLVDVPSLGWNFTKKQAFESVNCFAYGAARRAGEPSISEQNEESTYKTLFDETALLINPEEWLLQADYAASRNSEFREKRKRRLRQVKELLVKVLPDVNDIKITEKETDGIPFPTVEFHTPYGWVEAKDLSLGYRTSMAWMVDFASRMFDLYPESENPLAEPAVVLIDEIDLHLHPKWQRELLDYLSNLFPNTQFIVTTHSPLIVQSAAARDANIVVCRREGDHVVIDQSVEAVRNWRADQILTSDLFGLETARPKEIEPFLEERQKILSKAKLTKKDEKRLAELEAKIGSVPVMENPKYDEAMDIILRAAEKLEKKNGNPK